MLTPARLHHNAITSMLCVSLAHSSVFSARTWQKACLQSLSSIVLLCPQVYLLPCFTNTAWLVCLGSSLPLDKSHVRIWSKSFSLRAVSKPFFPDTTSSSIAHELQPLWASWLAYWPRKLSLLRRIVPCGLGQGSLTFVSTDEALDSDHIETAR